MDHAAIKIGMRQSNQLKWILIEPIELKQYCTGYHNFLLYVYNDLRSLLERERNLGGN